MATKVEKRKKEIVGIEQDLIKAKENPMATIREERARKNEVRNKIKKENVEVVMMNAVTTGQVYYKCPKSGATYEFNEFGDTDYFDYEVLSQMKNEHPKMFTDYVLIPISVMHDDITLEEVLEVLGLDRLYDENMLYEDNLDAILNMGERSLERVLEQNQNDKYLIRLAERSIARYKKDELNEDVLALVLDYVPSGDDLLVDITEGKSDDKLDKARKRRVKK